MADMPDSDRERGLQSDLLVDSARGFRGEFRFLAVYSGVDCNSLVSRCIYTRWEKDLPRAPDQGVLARCVASRSKLEQEGDRHER